MHRTNAFNYVSGFYFCAAVFGSATGSLLLSNHVYILNGLSISCFLATMPFTALIPSHYGYDKIETKGVQALPQPGEEDPLLSTPTTSQSGTLDAPSKVP